MTSIYGGTKGGIFGGSSAAKGYAATALKLAQEHQSHGDGGILGHVSGFVGNLANDVVNSAEGLPAGIVHLATQSPITSAKEIYASEKATWSPLLTGDYHKFVHNFYEHPLGPILDTVGLVTAGAGLAGKVGLLGDLGTGGIRTLKIGDKTEAIGRYADNPVIRGRQKAFDKITTHNPDAASIGQLKMTMPKSTPFIGEIARATRASERIQATKEAADQLILSQYNHAKDKLNKGWKHTAFMLFQDGRSPLERLDAQQKHLESWNTPIGKKLDTATQQHAAQERLLHEHLMIEYADPKKAARHAAQAANIQKKMDFLDQRAKELEAQFKTPESEEYQLNARALGDHRSNDLFHQAQEVHAKLKMNGYEDGVKNLRLDQASKGIKMSRDVHDLLVAHEASKAVVKRDAELSKIDPARVEQRNYLHHLLDAGAQMLPDKVVQYEHRGFQKLGQLQDDGKVHPIGARAVGSVGIKLDPSRYTKLDPLAAHEALEQFHPLDAPKVDRTYWHPNGIDKLLEKVKADHAKTGRAEPVYMPDKMMVNPRDRARGNKGIGRLKNIKVHENSGMLYMAGLLTHDPTVLSKKFLEDSMVAHAQDNASELLRHAEAHYGSEAPKGYVELSKATTSRGYMNQHLDTFRSDMIKALDENTPAKATRAFIDNHVRAKGDVTSSGDRHMLIVPEKMLNALVPEFHKSSAFVNAMWHKPGAVWKHIVLGGRPLPFIANNVIGNTVMYALRNNDFASMKALLFGHNEERAFEETQAGSHLTFGHANQLTGPGKIKKALNVGYTVSGAHEHLLRRATFIAAGKTMKIVKDAQKELKRAGYKAEENDGKTLFHAALDKAEKEHGGVHAEIEKRIEDTMGDYRHFNKAEKAIKSVMPFYAWNRHAMRAYYRLLTDKPLTAAMMVRVGQMGSAETNKMLGDVPAFMKAYLPAHVLKTLGYSDSGHTAVINSAVLNPEATVADTVKSVKALVSGKPQDAAPALTSNLSPFVTAPIEAVTGKSLLTGAPIKSNFGSSHGLLGATLASIATQLPQPKTIAALLPGSVPGSSHANPNNLSSQFTPTGRPKKTHADTVSKDWQTNLLNTLFGIPAKSIDIPAAQTWQKSIETKAAAALPHVAASRKKKTKGSIY